MPITTTDPQNELLTQVDENNIIIGSITRKKAHNTSGVFYRTIYILVKNNNGEILIQKRSATKDLYPNCWDLSVGGHVNFKKNYLETAVREIEEELGLTVLESDLKFIGKVLVKLPKSGEYFNVFEYSLKPKQDVKPFADEISSTRWMSINEIKKTIESKSLQWYERPQQVIKALY